MRGIGPLPPKAPMNPQLPSLLFGAPPVKRPSGSQIGLAYALAVMTASAAQNVIADRMRLNIVVLVLSDCRKCDSPGGTCRPRTSPRKAIISRAGQPPQAIAGAADPGLAVGVTPVQRPTAEATTICAQNRCVQSGIASRRGRDRRARLGLRLCTTGGFGQEFDFLVTTRGARPHALRPRDGGADGYSLRARHTGPWPRFDGASRAAAKRVHTLRREGSAE